MLTRGQTTPSQERLPPLGACGVGDVLAPGTIRCVDEWAFSRPAGRSPQSDSPVDIGGARGARLVARGILLLGTGTLIDGLMEMPDWPAMIQIGLLGVPWRSAGSGTPSIAASIDCRHGCGVVLSRSDGPHVAAELLMQPCCRIPRAVGKQRRPSAAAAARLD